MRARSAALKILYVLLFSIVAGVTLAAAALPVFALTGLATKYSVDSFESLPSDLKIPPTAQDSYVYASDGKTLLTTFYDENRRDVALSDVAPVMRQAIVAAEDSRYYQHGGVDLRSVLRAAVANGSGGASQGASTLTMQYVRNVLKSDPNLTEAQRQQATEDTVSRKVREMRYAIALEKRLSKQEILHRYLNIAYFGDGAYGIASASQTYFGIPPTELSLAQSALLAGLVQAPDSDNPVTGDEKAALDRRSYVLDAMAKMKVISPAEAARTEAEPLRLHPTEVPNDCTGVSADHNGWGFFCDYLRQWWDSQPAFGRTEQDRENALKRGGYTVVTSLDPSVQAAAESQSLSVYGYANPRALPIAVVTPGTGRVLAMAVNRHYGLPQTPGASPDYPYTLNPLIAGGGGIDGYQAGSTFKLFTMLAALESGLPLATRFAAPAQLVTHWPASGPGSCGGYYCPANANPTWMDGVRDMWTGYGRSVNTYFVWLEEQIGPAKAVAMAKRLGITFRAASDARMADSYASTWGSFTLGVAATTPLDLASAYATVAADGVYCKPLPVLSITDTAGHPVAAANPSCHQAVSQDIARAAADAARCPVGEESVYGRCDGGTAPEVSAILGGRPVGGKTGSSEQNATETFVGFTPQVAAAGIAANPGNPQDYVGSAVSSAVDVAVAKTMAVALRNLPYVSFAAPSAGIAFGSGGQARQAGQPSQQRRTTPPRRRRG